VAPDPGPAMAKDDLMVRIFTGASAARVSMGTEEEMRRAARALGGVLPADAPDPLRRLLVLDVDGVMIDAETSFAQAVAMALKELAPQQEWSLKHFQAFKHVGGFNNDFRLAAGALALAERGEMERLWKAAGVGFPDLEARIQELEPRCKEVVQRHYAKTKELEKPLVSKAELEALGWDVAIFTGRPPEELLLAEEVLGFTLPAVCDSAQHLRKPLPGGLLQLSDAFRSQEVVFAGDTRDDAACLSAARQQRPEISWSFAAIGPDKDRIAVQGDLKAESLRELLAVLSQG
jgi:phosphoglycolate phosphatase-like HAD superfamily hydrolase